MLMWATIFILSILVLFCYTGFRATQAYEQQIRNSMTQILQQYAVEIDGVLNEARRYVVNNQVNLLEWESKDELLRLEAISAAGRNISEDLSLHTKVDAAFLYSDHLGKINFIQNYNRFYPQSRLAATVIQEQLSLRTKNYPFYPQGFLYFSAGDHAYLYTAKDIPGGLFGCWFDLETIFEPLKNANLSGIEKIMLADRTGAYLDKDFSMRSKKQLQNALHPYFMTSQQLKAAPFRLVVLWGPNVVYAPVRTWLMKSGYFTIFAAIVLFIAYIAYLQIVLVKPLNRLVSAINNIVPDSKKTIAISKQEPIEIREVYTSLNAMISEIEELKIKVYEEKLIKQNAQMQLFQLQIRPHFFINALNTIVSFARAGNYEQIQCMAKYLAHHCRYVLYNGLFVTLQDELEYTQNYINMLSLQRDTVIEYDVDVQDHLLDLEIPILSLQIFVENSLKYATSQSMTLGIQVAAKQQKVSDDEVLYLLIQDTGSGFDQQTMAVLNSKKIEPHYGAGRGIGIANIRQRLMALYEGKADIVFSNNVTGGARVELFLPIHQMKGGDDN